MKPYFFKPLYQERIWGGRELEKVLQRELPAGKKIGESWELVDRPDAISEIFSGPGYKKGGRLKNLHLLWQEKRREVFGTGAPELAHFPLLIKVLDATDKLSIQVHPAPGQPGEPKTELWYFLECQPGATVYAGLKRGVTKETFTQAMGKPELPLLLHQLQPQQSDALFLPSGRVHAIGAGNLILEIQQSSDTTYRVDDWGRKDAKGKARPLHQAQALASIKFQDREPTFVQPHGERVVQCPYFSIERSVIYPDEYRLWNGDARSFQYHFLAQGELEIEGHIYRRGDGWLVPADAEDYELKARGDGAELITVQWGG